MKKRLVNAITTTLLVSSQIPLSYDESEGNVTVIKKISFKEKEVPTTSVGTVTYEIRKSLRSNFNWTLDSIVLNRSGEKIKNIYSKISNVESLEENGLESDMMGYFIPSSGKDTISKTSPLRIIPFRGLDNFPGTTQIITNRGMLDINDGREYFTPEGKKIEIDEKFPTSQAFVYEEVAAGYYIYTITIELNRVGVKEIKDGKVVAPAEREYMSKELREKAVKDILEALTILTRRIKHSTVFLKPLLVVGGAYEKVIPFFCEDIDYEKNKKKITLEHIKETIKAYNLENETIVAIDKRVDIAEEKLEEDKEDKTVKLNISKSPVLAIKNLADSLMVGDDNRWYVVENEKEDE